MVFRLELLVTRVLPVALCGVLGACSDDGGDSDETSSSTGSESSASATTTSSTTTTSTSSSGTTEAPTGSSTADDATGSSGSTSDETTTGETGSSSGSGTGSSTGTGSSSGSESSSSSTGLGDCIPLLAEALVDAEGGSDELQWVKLYNPCSAEISLDGYTIGYGGEDYEGTLPPRNKPLSGPIGAGECFLVGGPNSSKLNGAPVDYELADDFAPGLLSGVGVGAGLALFDAPPDEVDATTVPIDAVVYGPNNDNDLIDETGLPVANPHAATPPIGGSVVRTGLTSWETAETPSPNACPKF